jgi:uncharacterized protein YjiS (DUF1127 family)
MEAAMSIYSDTQTPSHFAWLVNAVVGIVVARSRQAAEMLKNRRDATILAGLDDHMLADIGLTRGDVRDAFSESVWSDPTAILVSRVNERRTSRRRGVLAASGGVIEAPSIVPALPKHVSVNRVG